MKSLVPFELDKTRRNVELFGASPPGFFVGHFNYPNVYLGPLVPFQEFELDLGVNDNYILDAPELWYGKKINEIVTNNFLKPFLKKNGKGLFMLNGSAILKADSRDN